MTTEVMMMMMKEMPLLVLAACQGDAKVVEMLCSQEHIRSQINQEVYTHGRHSYYPPLFYAKNVQVVEVLLRSGARVSNKSEQEEMRGRKLIMIKNGHLCTKINLITHNTNLWSDKWFSLECLFSSLLELEERCPELLSLTGGDHRHIITHHLTTQGVVHVDGVRGLRRLVDLGVDIKATIGHLVHRVLDGLPFMEHLEFLLSHVERGVLFSELNKEMREYDDVFNSPNNLVEMLQVLFSKGFRLTTTYFTTFTLFSTPEYQSLFDLFYCYNLPISVNYLTGAMRCHKDDWNDIGEEESLEHLMKIVSHLLKLGVSMMKKDSEGESALSLAQKWKMPQEFVDLLIREGYDQERWKEEHRRRFREVEGEIKWNMDFGSEYIQNCLKVYTRQEVMQTPICGPRPSLYSTSSWLVMLKESSKKSAAPLAIYQHLRRVCLSL